MPRLTARRARRGLTMVELLVTMVVLAVIGTLVATTMLGQQRFFQNTYEMVGVRRELRTAMSMVPADVRGFSSIGGDVSAFSESSLRFRATFGASIVCARSGASTLFLPPLDLRNHTLTSWTEQPQPGDTLFAFDEGALRGAEDDRWVPLTVSSITPDLTQCLGAPFTSAADLLKPRWRVVVAEAVPATVLIGAGLRFAHQVQYALEKSPATERWYLAQTVRRSGAWENPVIVSGPYEVPANGGMRLTYFDSLGVQLNPGVGANRIARVDLFMQAAGVPGSSPLYKGGDATPRDSLAFRIAIRNRQ